MGKDDGVSSRLALFQPHECFPFIYFSEAGCIEPQVQLFDVLGCKCVS